MVVIGCLKVKSKLKNVKVEVDGIKFDSKMEAEYYQYLLDAQWINKADRIIIIKPKFQLQSGYAIGDRKIREISYIPDFGISYYGKMLEVHEVKGMATPDWKIKRKLFEYIHKIPLKVVVKYGCEWVDWDENEVRKRKNRRAK